jgi:hypothetical protein
MFTSQGAKGHKGPPHHVFGRCKMVLLLLGDYSIFGEHNNVENVQILLAPSHPHGYMAIPHVFLSTYSAPYFIHKLILKISMAHSKVLSHLFTRWSCFCYAFRIIQYATPPPSPPPLVYFHASILTQNVLGLLDYAQLSSYYMAFPYIPPFLLAPFLQFASKALSSHIVITNS